jgi:murein DD-endopeptidase MepM/ murein hydrolase activator NlpD
MSESASSQKPQPKHHSKLLLAAALMGLSVTTLGFGQKLVNAEESLAIRIDGSDSIPNWERRAIDIEAPTLHPQESIEQIAYASNWQSASFPVENFQTYTSPFGPRGGGFHYGLDLAAPEGSYIRNWWAGKVVEVWEDSRCGTGIAIQSGYWEHIYCHVQGRVDTSNGRKYFIDRAGGITLWEGQTVRAGDRIARVGMTGRTSGPHLHWGLKYSGEWVDPGLILREMYAQQSRRLSNR